MLPLADGWGLTCCILQQEQWEMVTGRNSRRGSLTPGIQPLARDHAGTEGQGAAQLNASLPSTMALGNPLRGHSLKIHPRPCAPRHYQPRNPYTGVIRASGTLVAFRLWAQLPHLYSGESELHRGWLYLENVLPLPILGPRQNISQGALLSLDEPQNPSQ